MSITTYQFFYRNNIQCLLAFDNRLDQWIGLIGLSEQHSFYKSIFVKIANVSLYHYSLQKFLEGKHQNRHLWYLGFVLQTYSKEKVLNKLKEVADSCPSD